jgi:signal transduction histidine kinase
VEYSLGPKARTTGVISVIFVIVLSVGLFIYTLNVTESSIKASLFDQQKERQVEAATKISEHIGSDLNLVLSTLDGLANSYYLQEGDLHSQDARSLVEEKYAQLDPTVKGLFVLDKNDIVTISLAPPSSETFLSADFSLRDWVIETRANHQPVFSNGFERQGMYRVFISYPIINKSTHEYIGIIGVSIPTVSFFAHYANVEDINSQFLIAYDHDGVMLANGASASLVGKNFFGKEAQASINHNPVLNNLTKSLLQGHSGYGVYDYGDGERITTQYPVFVQGKPTYFIQLVTPTTQIYSEVNDALFAERTKLGLLLTGTISAITILVILLIKWNNILNKEVKIRTRELGEANERLQANIKTQREFLNIAAHELRTPIQPILGLAEVLYDTDNSGSSNSNDNNSSSTIVASSQEKHLLEIIIRNARRLQGLSEDLLDVSRIESQSLKLNKVRFNLADVVARTVEDLGNSFASGDKKVELVAVPYEGREGDVIVNADKERIVQVISNLLHNALEFTREGTIWTSIQRKDGQTIVTVRDTGDGIDAEVFPRLFTKFVTKSKKGTGLGLFISKGIIEAHGGKMWAENNANGKGAAFFFSIPDDDNNTA